MVGGGAALEGLRRRHPAARAGRDRRAGLDHRGRRAGAGGGSGWLERSSASPATTCSRSKLVTADGRTVIATEDENPELFWALPRRRRQLRDGHRLDLPPARVARSSPRRSWSGRREAGPEVTGAYRDFAESAPDEVGGGQPLPDRAAAGVRPGIPPGQAGLRGPGRLRRPRGRGARGDRAAAGRGPEGQMIAEMPYAGLQCMLDDPPGFRNYWSAEYLDQLPTRRSTPSAPGPRG